MSRLAFDLTLCVGTPRLRSAAWRIFVPARSSDIYLTCLEFKSSFKVSLHPSGKCHLAFASADEYDRASSGWAGNFAFQDLPAELVSATRERGGRFHRVWEMKMASSPTLPCHIAVPIDYLSSMSSRALTGRAVSWIQRTEPRTMVVISLVLSGTADHWAVAPLRQLLLPSGLTMGVLITGQPTDRARIEWIERFAKLPVAPGKQREAERANTEIPRTILPCVDSSAGVLGLWDIGRVMAAAT